MAEQEPSAWILQAARGEKFFEALRQQQQYWWLRRKQDVEEKDQVFFWQADVGEPLLGRGWVDQGVHENPEFVPSSSAAKVPNSEVSPDSQWEE